MQCSADLYFSVNWSLASWVNNNKNHYKDNINDNKEDNEKDNHNKDKHGKDGHNKMTMTKTGTEKTNTNLKLIYFLSGWVVSCMSKIYYIAFCGVYCWRL